MNLQFYLEKLFSSEKFQSFMKKNPSAYFCSGFFSIDRQRENPLTTLSKRDQSKENKGNKIHLDYIIPKTKKIFSFQLEGETEMVPIEQSGDNILERIPDNIDFDFGEIEKMIVEKMREQEIKNKIQKIIFSLQKIEKKSFLVGTVFISGLGMIKIKIDLEEKKITEFEKKSFFDLMKIVKKK